MLQARSWLPRAEGTVRLGFKRVILHDRHAAPEWIRNPPCPLLHNVRKFVARATDASPARSLPNVEESVVEYREILEASISYYPNDLLVVGWSAAFVFDNPAAAGPTIQLLEYANTQLLEFRHYDELLTSLLAGVYRSIDKGTGVWRRWGLAGEAESLNTVRLDVIEIAERTETSIKFLSDMFYARMYRLAAARVGVPDYRRMVDHKLQTAGELYEFMVDRFDSGRGFFLEVVVVIILLIEIVFLFRGKG